MNLNSIKIVLVNTSHPGNIGACARAMKTMGLTQLTLVDPKQFPHHEATVRASGADDLLAQAQVVSSLNQALEDCTIAMALSARSRNLQWPLLSPEECAQKALSFSKHDKVAIVFGPEQSGLSNTHLQQCQYLVTIPTSPDYSSLNLAQAVQIVAWEMSKQSNRPLTKETRLITAPLCNQAQMEGFFQHLEHTLIDINFLNPKQPKRLMPRLRRYFGKRLMDEQELNIFRGILRAVQLKGRSRIQNKSFECDP